MAGDSFYKKKYMKVVIASDHGGFQYKNLLSKEIIDRGYELADLGAFSEAPSDYPDYAEAVANALLNGVAEKGILICGSGVGVSVAANKFKGVRAGVCHDTYSAHQCVEHDNVNVLCIGQRVIGIELAREIIFAFLAAVFSNEERHKRRLEKINAIEMRNMK
jgi:ribose 5-phosphate isomerase B